MSGIDLAELGTALHRGADGLWRPRSGATRDVSFPSEGYDSCFGIEDSSFWFAHRNACIVAVLGRERIAGSFLDVGGGNGVVSQALERAGIETVVIEPGEAGARNAVRRELPTVACSTLEDARFPAGSVAAVGMFDVIEHVDDTAPLLAEVHRVLQPGGIACVTVPAYSWLWSEEDHVAGHFRRYTQRSLTAELDANGFSVTYGTYMFGPLVPPILAARRLPYLVGKVLRRPTSVTAESSAPDHTPSTIVRRAVDLLLAPELAQIRAGRRVPFGTSVLAVATKRGLSLRS